MDRRKCLLGCLLLLCSLACAQSTVGDLLEQKLAEKIRKLDDSLDGVLGVAAIDLTTGRIISYNGGVTFPQASSIKVPILIQVFRAARAGEFGLEDSVTLMEKDLVGGSGHLQERVKKAPVTLTVRDLARAMIENSDNLATNKLIEMVGIERVNRTLEELGFWGIRLQRRMMDAEAAARDDENIATPVEMARLVETIYRGRAVDQAASSEMLALMKRVKADFRKVVPAKIEVASKPGDLPGVHCETGVVFLPKRPFVLSVMSTLLAEGSNPVPGVVSMVCAHFQKLAASNRYGHRLQ